ncbi:macrophage-expressed gene 1 protein-like [Montipora capricornis]|uniref:macrophage-expressed gene 1 protein-like n=1 Tax=Montipora capricornis TaxID=246305 RepID=UPI0035F171FD
MASEQSTCLFWCVFLLFAVMESSFALTQNDSSQFQFLLGDPRNCPLPKEVDRFEVLPGGGWDNLRNVHMGAVVSLTNYSKCKTSNDGKYLIPDKVFLYPVKESKVEAFAELYDHWNTYSSTTTKSINAESFGRFDFGSIDGSYSSEFESVKKHQVKDKAVTTRVQMRHELYTAKLQPDSPLEPEFKFRLLEIASHIQHNNTQYSNFLAQILVRDFGTHYVSSVKAGAVLAKVDHLKTKFYRDLQKENSQITAYASASFHSVFEAWFSYSQATDTKVLDEYTNSTVYSTVLTFGGRPFRVNLTINQWVDQLQDELVAVDRSGDPLHYVITPGTLPELSEELTFELANVVERAIKQYYKHNTIKGCTQMDSPKVSCQANLDDGSCESPTKNYTFGGVYQTCQFEGSPSGDPCAPLRQKNPLTADYKCSPGYKAILVHQGSTRQSCHRECHRCRLFFKCCNTNCGYAAYSTYWCAPTGIVPPKTGYLFGGLYSNIFKNPLTQDHSCPERYYALQFGGTMQICVSDDYELRFQNSVTFGGLFSCSTGNPLAVAKPAVSGKGLEGSKLEMFVSQSGPTVWPKTCPTGYSQHLGAIEQDCEINFCVKSNVFNDHGLPIIKRPPYMSKPKVFNYSVPLLLINEDTGQIWFRNPSPTEWTLATKSSVTLLKVETSIHGPSIMGMNPASEDIELAATIKGKSSHDSMDAGTAAGITFGVTALAGLLIAAMVIGWRRHKTVRTLSHDVREPLVNSLGEYGAVGDNANGKV